MPLQEKIETLRSRYASALKGGGQARIDKQHQGNKLTARERIAAFLDEGSFEEVDALAMNPFEGGERIPGDGVVTGFGRVDGRPVAIFAQDFTVIGGSLSLTHARKICKVMDMAMKVGCPVIGFNDSGGARIQEGVNSLAGYAEIFLRNTMASGVLPQISLIMGPCAGGAVYSPAITDFITMVRNTSYMFVTGPEVIKAVTHEDVTKEELGGASAHGYKSGVAHFLVPSDLAALAHTRELLSFLPSNNLGQAPRRAPLMEMPLENPELDTIIPEDPSQALRRAPPHQGHRRRRAFLRGDGSLRRQHRHRLRPHGRAQRRHHRQPARPPGRGAGHRLQRKGRPVRAVLRLPSTSP